MPKRWPAVMVIDRQSPAELRYALPNGRAAEPHEQMCLVRFVLCTVALGTTRRSRLRSTGSRRARVASPRRPSVSLR